MSARKLERPSKMELHQNPEPITNPKEWEKLVQAGMNRYRKIMRKNPEKGDAINTFDLTDSMMRRRQRAIVNTIPKLYEHYHAPESNQPILGETWRDLNLPFLSYSQLDAHSHILFAASIWILDQITALEHWRELYRYLPKDEKALDELVLHDVWHAEYDYDLIYSVEYVLHHRNPVEKDGSDYPRVMTSDYLAKNSLLAETTTAPKHKTLNACTQRGLTEEDRENRKNYNAVINMIPQNAINQAVTHFREYARQWVNRFFQAVSPFFEAESEREVLIRETQIQYNQTVDLICAAFDHLERVRKNHSRKGKRPAVTAPFSSTKMPELLSPPVNGSITSFLDGPPHMQGGFPGVSGFAASNPELEAAIGEAMRLSEKLDDIGTRSDEMIDELNEIQIQLRTFCMNMTRRGRITSDLPPGEGVVTVKPMPPLEIADPYELCFALLYLIEADDDLPWLYGVGCGLMAEVIENLPWGIIEYDETDDDAWENWPAELPKSVSLPEWYARKYRRKDDFDFPRNLAQILYEETGCVLPRDMDIYGCRAKLLGKYGIRGKDAAWLIVLMSCLGTTRRECKALNLDGDAHLWGDVNSERAAESSGEGKEKELADELKAEIKRLKSSLHSADQENRETKKTLAALKAASEREHRELADLREYVFRQEREEQADEETPENSQWPYEVQRDTLVFGGHATWVKGIRSILTGNIRFIDKDLVFDIGIVRHADVIWIQPNALSHPMYWRVVDTARMHGKPVRYFSFASWIKCAEQIAAGDK